MTWKLELLGSYSTGFVLRDKLSVLMKGMAWDFKGNHFTGSYSLS
jgi:hypothetical protein